MKNSIFGVLFLFLLFGFQSCTKTNNKNEESDSTTAYIQKNVSGFSADSAYQIIKKQLDFGFRIPGTPAHKKCADWLYAELKKSADESYFQTLSGTNPRNGSKIPIYNIVGSFNPTATNRLLLASHWDSRPSADQDTKDQDKPILAANDGASGVAVLLEIARNLSKNKPEIGVDIIFFDAEDLGIPSVENSFCLGSQAWAKTPHKPGYTANAGILLDMVGGKNAKFVWEAYSAEFGNFILNQTWGIAHELGYNTTFPFQSIGPIIDDHKYVYEGTKIPMIDIIQYDEVSGFAPYWHTHSDNLDAIDKNTLMQVGNTVHHVIFNPPFSVK